ncbi:hypothetical protein [Leucobacter sp. GX24907]
MTTKGFQYLPAELQDLITNKLDDEVLVGFAEIEVAIANGQDDLVRSIETGIARVSKLREELTGESVVI